MAVVRGLAEKYHLHPLAVEDVLHVTHRPKVEAFDETARRPGPAVRHRADARAAPTATCSSEQISIFLGHQTVLTFQESPGDVWDGIRQRIQTPGLAAPRGTTRASSCYSLLDAIVDHCFPILEFYGDRLEDVEAQVLHRPDRETIQDIGRLKRELLLLRRAVWPMREVISTLQREPHECMSDAHAHLHARRLRPHGADHRHRGDLPRDGDGPDRDLHERR